MLYEILFEGKTFPYNPDSRQVDMGQMFGFIKEQDGNAVIANRIYETCGSSGVMNNIKIDRKNINPDDIKANMYDNIQLTVDMEGITEQDISDLEKRFAELFDKNRYTLDKTEMYLDELRAYEKRNALEYTNIQEQRLLNQESVLRYTTFDHTEVINICTKFVYIKLNYELYHKLQNEIELFMKVVKCLSSRNYFKIIGIGIKERDRIVCDTLPKLYRCFEKNMFGDIAYKFHQQGKSAKSYVVNSNSCFCIDSFVANVDRKVVRGQFEDKESYMGILEIEVMDIIDDIDDMDKVLSEIKKVCFDIFLNHITDTMVMDLLNGETKLIKEGFNKNE